MLRPHDQVVDHRLLVPAGSCVRFCGVAKFQPSLLYTDRVPTASNLSAHWKSRGRQLIAGLSECPTLLAEAISCTFVVSESLPLSLPIFGCAQPHSHRTCSAFSTDLYRSVSTAVESEIWKLHQALSWSRYFETRGASLMPDSADVEGLPPDFRAAFSSTGHHCVPNMTVRRSA